MIRSAKYLLLALFVAAGFVHDAGAAEAQLLPAVWMQAAPASDPVVGDYDSVRYGTMFKFEADGKITGADGIGDGTWQVADPGRHIYTVKIRPSKMDSPDRYESWTLLLENGGLTQNGGQTTIFSRAK